jgi:RNA polymerase sigma factor (sigma-70 family)
MKIGDAGSVRRDLGRLFDGHSIVGLGEAELLDRFVDRRDAPAFEALVARHGPMVLAVCRRLLTDPSDVEDAFQATFLIFIRRASSIRGRDRLAPWLFGVARKVASRTRSDRMRRRAREVPGAEEIAETANPQDVELSQALFEEIDRLPDSLRLPILLCCVEGLSYDEAANRMQSTAPSVRGRLSRARERLRDRLTRRGFAPSVVTAGGWLAGGAGRVALPSRLLFMTTQLAKAGALPSSVAILVEGVIQTMIVTKSKLLFASLLACGVAGLSAGLYAQKPGRDVTPKIQELERKLNEAREQQAGSAHPAPAQTVRRMVPVTEETPKGLITSMVEVTETTVAPAIEELNTPTEPVAQIPGEDRLDKLEKKLDRVLDALEGSGRPTRITRDTNGNPPTRVTPPQPPRASSAARSADQRPVGVAVPPQAPRFPQDATLESRVMFLEENIKHLNARIAELERKLSQPQVILEEKPDGSVVPFNPDHLPTPKLPPPDVFATPGLIPPPAVPTPPSVNQPSPEPVRAVPPPTPVQYDNG